MMLSLHGPPVNQMVIHSGGNVGMTHGFEVPRNKAVSDMTNSALVRQGDWPCL